MLLLTMKEEGEGLTLLDAQVSASATPRRCSQLSSMLLLITAEEEGWLTLLDHASAAATPRRCSQVSSMLDEVAKLRRRDVNTFCNCLVVDAADILLKVIARDILLMFIVASSLYSCLHPEVGQ